MAGAEEGGTTVRTRTITTAALLALALSYTGCANGEGHAAAPQTAPDEPLLSPADAIPSQEQADAEALATIDEGNADAEFEKLKQELGGG